MPFLSASSHCIAALADSELGVRMRWVKLVYNDDSLPAEVSTNQSIKDGVRKVPPTFKDRGSKITGSVSFTLGIQAFRQDPVQPEVGAPPP